MVVDASVWVSRLVPQDIHHATSRDWLKSELTSTGVVVGPVLLLPEVAGAVSRQTKRPRLGKRAVRMLLRLPGLRLVPLENRLGTTAAEIAAALGLRGADAVYVATAHHLNIPLVTWDVEQRERAGRLITVLTPTARPVTES
jgi:predicted nucleic acid-binding protein